MKNLILAATLVATVMGSAASADVIKLSSDAWYSADVSVRINDGPKIFEDTINMHDYRVIEVPDGSTWTVKAEVIWGANDLKVEGTGDAKVKIGGSLFNAHIQKHGIY